MKISNAFILGIGVLTGLLVAPKKGSETANDLKNKAEEFYYKAKDYSFEQTKDQVIDKIEDIKIGVSKLDAERSKEIVNEKAEVIKTKLNDIITDLQKNKKIKGNVNKVVDTTKDKLNEIIEFIDEKDLVEKTKQTAQKVVAKSVEGYELAKEKSKQAASNVKSKVKR